ILRGLTATAVQMENKRTVQEIPRNKVAVIGLSTELATTLKPKAAYARFVLSNGTRLSLSKAAFKEGKTLAGTTLFGDAVNLPTDDIRAIYLCQAQAVYLSDLKARDYEFTSYLSSSHWPYVRDGCVSNHDLRLDGSTFDKGLGQHSQSRLTYDLGGNYRRFEALVGLDEQSGREGTAQVRVLVDGKPRDLGRKPDLSGLAKPLAISLDITGAKQLTLVVEFGKRGSVASNVDWADARLIK